MKKLLIVAFWALLLGSCSNEKVSDEITYLNEDFSIITVQHRYFMQGVEVSKEDEINTFHYNKIAKTLTWMQEGNSEAWIYKVTKETKNNFWVEEPATKDDVAHLILLRLSEDRKTIMLYPLDEKGVSISNDGFDYYDTIKK